MTTIDSLLDAHRAAIIASRTSVAVDAMAAGDLTCLRAVRAARDALVDAGVPARLADAHGQAVADWLDGRRDATAVIAARETILRPEVPVPVPDPDPDPDALPCGVLRGAYCRPGGCGWCRGYERGPL